jgi:serine/threonine-protein kinase
MSERLPTQSGSAVLSAGDWIGGYEIQERLRSGGMAMMYLARRHGTAGFSRRIALKVIHPHLTFDSRFINMFVDEARISSHISHPNVVHVEEFGCDGGLYFLAMEHIDGCSLNDVLRVVPLHEKPQGVEIATRIAMQIAAGLHAAHETRGEDGQPLHIIHRDVSPANVLLSREGGVKLIDFGIAKARGRLAATATEGTIKGKLRYMSPEQALCKTVDRRADVYSLGVVYWELLTGKPLFGDTDDEAGLLWTRIGREDMPAPSTINAAVPPAIDALVKQMLAREADARIATAWDARRAMAQHVPGALSIDVGELSALVTEVGKHPPAEDAGEPSPVFQASRTPVPTRPTPRPTQPSVQVPDDVEITVTPTSVIHRHWKSGAAAAAVLVLGVIVLAARGGHDVSAPPAPAPAPAPAIAPPPAPAPAPAPAPPPVVVAAPPAAPTPVAVPAPPPAAPEPARHRVPAHIAARPQPAPTTPPAQPPPQEGPRPTAVGGHTIADRPDDVGATKQKSKKPATVGKTPIADDFEE